MKTITIKDIRGLKPCYAPNRYLSEDFNGTVLDILNHKDIPDKDKLWVVLRTKFIDEKTLRLFAVKCARYSAGLLSNEFLDIKNVCLNTCQVAEDYANGKVDDAARSTVESAADSAADSAAYSVAYSAAYSAARSATYSAAESAAYSTSRSAAYSAAESAARSAARFAAYSAARSAAYSTTSSAAYSAAYSAARSATYSAAVQFLIELLLPPTKLNLDYNTANTTINDVSAHVNLGNIVYYQGDPPTSPIILSTTASKNDKSKPDISLIPLVSMVAHAEAFMVGEKKYGRYNYCKGHKTSQLIAAAQRHLLAYFNGEERCPIDGQPHLGSVMACCSIILRQAELGTLIDDRYKPEDKK